MYQFRKILSFLLLVVLISLLSFGCGSDSNNSTDKDSSTKTDGNNTITQTEGSKTSEETMTVTESSTITEDSNKTQTEDTITTDTSATANGEYIIKDYVVVDNDQCKFTITGTGEDSIWGFGFTVLMENKSDKTLMFSMDSAIVNGYCYDPFWAEEVDAGQTKTSLIDFDLDDLAGIGIESIDELTFTLYVYDSNDFLADAIVESTYTIYPTGKTADQIVVPERKKTDSEVVLLDNDQVTFIILESYVDDFWGYTISCYCENKTDNPVMFSWDDVTVNDYSIDPWYANEIPAHSQNYSEVTFNDSDFEENNITEVKEIDFHFNVYDSATFDDIYSDTQITYTP